MPESSDKTEEPAQGKAGESDSSPQNGANADPKPEESSTPPNRSAVRRSRKWRKEPQVKKLHNIKSPAVNPFLMILDQHSAHRVRIVKAVALATLVSVLILLAYFWICKKMEKDALDKEIHGAEEALGLIEKDMSSKSGYARSKLVFESFKWIDHISERDPLNRIKWEKKRQSFLDKIIDVKPEIGADFVVPSAALDMVFIPRGQFLMGRLPKEPGANSDELPQRLVTLSYDFWIMRTEISNAQFNELYPGRSPESWDGFRLNLPAQPLVRVDWHTAQKFCEKLTEMERKAGRVPEGYEYRLPTEAEWEYSCRAGTDTFYYWGSEFGAKGAEFANSLDKKAAARFGWKSGSDMADADGYLVSARTSSYKPNAFSLYDMSGNVWEWCYDWYNPRAYKDLPALNPVQAEPVVASIEIKTDFDRRYNADCTSKVLRGGSWGNLPLDCRSATRSASYPEDARNTGIGFRVAMAPLIIPPKSDLEARKSSKQESKAP